MQPTFEWVPREQNTVADELSKVVAATIPLRAGAEGQLRAWLTSCGAKGVSAQQWQQTQIYVPRWDCIGHRVQELLRRREPACIVVPRWHGAAWGDLLRRNSSDRWTFGGAWEVLNDPTPNVHNVLMQAFLVLPRPGGRTRTARKKAQGTEEIRNAHRPESRPGAPSDL